MKLRQWLCASMVLSLTLVLLAPRTPAQTAATGSLSGTVTDPSGAVIPNVAVTLTSSDTGQKRTTTTGADGSYRVGLLPPGSYHVKFEATGFRAVESPNVTVTVTETGILNQTLAVSGQTQEVTVTANVEALQTSNATLGGVVNTQTVVELPLTTRNYTNLLALSAGTAANLNDARALGKGSLNIAVNGAATGQNNFQMDGVSVMNLGGFNNTSENGFYGSFGIPNPDALQEFKIQTSTYDASYGRNPGANVNVVTKSGTNAFHGTAFEFFRNTALNANDWFLNLAGQPRGVLNENQFGGTVGGPVKKDKLFFFVSFQETEQKNGLNAAGFSASDILAPIPLGDRSTLAFKTALGAALCPNAGTVTPTTQSEDLANTNTSATTTASQSKAASGAAGSHATLTGAQVACTGANIDPVALAVLNLKNANGTYYIPSALDPKYAGFKPAPGGQGYTQGPFSIPAIYHERQGVGNFDYVESSKNTLSGRYFYGSDPTLYTVNPTTGSNFVPGSGGNVKFTNHEAVLRLTTIVTSNFVNEARVSYQRELTENIPAINYTDSQLGITPLTIGIDRMPQSTISSPTLGLTMFSYGTHTFQLHHEAVNQFEAADQISWAHDKHTVRAGFEAERDQWNSNAEGLEFGALGYNTFADFLLGLPGCQPSLSAAACLATANTGTTPDTGTTGVFTSALQTTSPGSTSRSGPNGLLHFLRFNAFDAFGQDDFKVTSRLTLNIGLRWEFDGTPTDISGSLSNTWPTQLNKIPIPGANSCSGTFSGVVVPNDFKTNFPITVSTKNTGGTIGIACPAGSSVYNTYTVNGVVLPANVLMNSRGTPRQGTSPLTNFAPRLGFAWQPLNSNRFVVRGGGGYFYDRIPGDSFAHVINLTDPFVNSLGVQNTDAFAATSAQPWGPPAPNGWVRPRWASADGQSSALSGGEIGQFLITPVVYQWNLGVQYQFLPRWTLEVGYVGSRGIHQIGAQPINQSEIVTNNSAAFLDALPANLQIGTVPSVTLADGTVTTDTTLNRTLRVPYLGLANTFSATDSKGDEKFNSLQFTVRKQMSYGLSLQAAYTYSRGFLSTYTDSPYHQIYGPNTSYRPQRLVVNFAWEVPTGKHQGLTDKLVDGWTLAGVMTLQDGTPLTVTDSAGGTITGTTATGLYCSGKGPGSILNGAGSLSNRVATNTYFNTGVFCSTFTNISTLGAPAGSSGTLFVSGTGSVTPSALGAILGPGQYNWDATISKKTVVGGLREDAILEFRAEFFDLFNHVNFSNPATTVGPTLGKITTTASNGRLVQFALKYVF